MPSLSAFYDALAAHAAQYLANLVVNIPGLLFGILVALFFWWLAGRLRARFLSFSETRGWPVEIELLVAQIIYVTVLFIGTLVVVELWDQDVTPLIASIGVVGGAVGFALRNILENFIAGILLLVQRPFGIGDQIKSGDFQGEVEAINLRATLIRTSDYRQVIIPNAAIYTSSVVNLTRYPWRRSTLVLAVPAQPDLEATCRAILERLRSVDGVLSDPAPEVVVTGLDPSGVKLEARYWTEPRGATVNRVASRVVHTLAEVSAAGPADHPAPLQILKMSLAA